MAVLYELLHSYATTQLNIIIYNNFATRKKLKLWEKTLENFDIFISIKFLTWFSLSLVMKPKVF